MAGEEQAIIAFMVGLICCLGTGVALLAVGGFLLWKRSSAEASDSVSSEVVAVSADEDGEDTLVAERPSVTPEPPIDDGPSIATQAQGGSSAPPAAAEPPRRAAQTIIAFDDDFDDDEEL